MLHYHILTSHSGQSCVPNDDSYLGTYVLSSYKPMKRSHSTSRNLSLRVAVSSFIEVMMRLTVICSPFTGRPVKVSVIPRNFVKLFVTITLTTFYCRATINQSFISSAYETSLIFLQAEAVTNKVGRSFEGHANQIIW